MDEVLYRIEKLAQQQHSIVSWDQLLAVGAAPVWIHRREREGFLTRVAPASYRVMGVRRGFHNRAIAAVLSARGPAVVSHRSAAWLHRLEPDIGVPGVVHLTVPRHRRVKRRAGLVVHETRAWERREEVVRDLIPVTGVARTILDCAALVPDPVRLLDEALRLRLVSWPELWDCLLGHVAPGRRGVRVFRNILLLRDGKTPPHGEFVRRLGKLLTGAGLPEPVYEHRVWVDGHDYSLDAAYLPHRVCIECNDRSSHDTPRAFQRDPMKRNRCELAGWAYLEFTWHHLVHHADEVVTQVRAALAARSGA